MDLQLPKSRQPDALPPPAPLPPPIWLYIILSGLSVLGIAVAFRILGKPDWPSLLMNLSSGLITSVLLLIVVDQRIRQSEIRAVLALPTRASLSIRSLISPQFRLRYYYAKNHLAALDVELTRSRVIERATLRDIEASILRGVNLVASAGMGKTTTLQVVAAKNARRMLQGDTSAPLVILFSLRHWRTDRSLLAEVIEHIAAFIQKSPSQARKLLTSRPTVILLDALDEIADLRRPFEHDLTELRAFNHAAVVTVSSRSSYGIPMPNREVVSLPGPSDVEVEKIRSQARGPWS